MGVPYIPGPETVLGPALEKVGKAINDIVDPSFQFNLQFRQHLAENPQLLQELADAEHLSPGSLSNLTGPNKKPLIPEDVMQTIHAMAPSSQALAREGQRHYLATLSPKDRDTILAARSLGVNAPQLARELPVAHGIEQVAATEPPVALEAGRREMTGGAGAGNIAQSGLEAENVGLTMQALSRMSPEDRERYATFQSMPALMQDQHQQAIFAQQERMLALRLAERQDELAQRSQDRRMQYNMQAINIQANKDIALGNSLASSSGFGDPTRWVEFLHGRMDRNDPEYAQYAAARSALHQNAIQPKLLANSNYVSRLSAQITQGIRGTSGELQELTPEAKNANLAQINTALQENDALTNTRSRRAIVLRGKLEYVPADDYDVAMRIRNGQGITLNDLATSRRLTPAQKGNIRRIIDGLENRNSFAGQ